MKGDWFEVLHQRKPGEHTRYCGFVRFAVDAVPFHERAVERGQVRFYWRSRLPWDYDLPGGEAGQVFSGPIAYAEWFARECCGLKNGEAQAYRKTGCDVWVVDVTNGERAITVEVFVDRGRYDACEIVSY